LILLLRRYERVREAATGVIADNSAHRYERCERHVPINRPIGQSPKPTWCSLRIGAAPPDARVTRRTAGIARLIAAAGISWTGDWALITGASVAVYRDTNSTAAVSLLLACAAIPAVLFAPVAGAVADRYDRRKVMFFADVLSALLCAVALAGIDTRAELAVTYGVVLALGVFSAFHRPASEALLPSLAHADELSRANSVLRLAQRLGTIAGPAAGAWLIDRGGLDMVLMVDAVSFGASAAIVAAIPGVPRAAGRLRESTFRAAAAGFRYARERANIRTVIASIGVTMLVAPIVNAGTVTFVSEALHKNESWYGWLLAAQGVGAIACAAALIILGPRTRLLPTGLAGLIVTGGAVIALASAQEVVLALAAMWAMGVGVVALQVAFASYLQQQAEDAYRGRVMGLVATVASLGNLAGLAATPLAVLALGVRPAFFIAGAVIVASALPILEMLRRRPARLAVGATDASDPIGPLTP